MLEIILPLMLFVYVSYKISLFNSALYWSAVEKAFSEMECGIRDMEHQLRDAGIIKGNSK